MSLYNEVYGGGEFDEVRLMSRRIIALSTVGVALGAVGALYEPVAAAQQIDDLSAQTGKLIFGRRALLVGRGTTVE